MNYTFHQLQIFLEVVRQKSITKAAEEMHMTQPALSIQLKNFQNQFDIPLTELVGKKIYITEFGKDIAQIAENVIAEADAIKHKTKEYNGLVSGKLRITSASGGKYVVPYFLGSFLNEFPGIKLSLDVSNRINVLSELKSNKIDFAFISVLPNDIAVHEEILLENRLYLVGNTEQYNPDKPLIYREEGSATRVAMDQHFGSTESRKGLTLTSNEAVKQAVLAGLGYSLLPLIGIRNEIQHKQLFIYPVKNLPITTNWRLVWLKSKKLTPSAEAYLNYIKTNKYKIIDEHFKWFFDFIK